MAIYAIGDIHGSYNALTTLFKNALFTKDDTIVLLGDYVDKGPDTNLVLQFLIEQQKKFNLEFIKGNHDIAMLNAINSEENFLEWYSFGGESTVKSYGIDSFKNWYHKVPKAHLDLLEDSKPYQKIKNFIFVHAGLQPNVPLNQQDDFHLYWKKYEVPEQYSATETVICGHTSRKNGEIADFGHTICIDTFAHGGKWLTCFNVETKEFIKTNNNHEIIKGSL